MRYMNICHLDALKSHLGMEMLHHGYVQGSGIISSFVSFYPMKSLHLLLHDPVAAAVLGLERQQEHPRRAPLQKPA